MKRFAIAALAFLACTFAHADEGWTLKEKATAAAAADGITTIGFLATKTAVEANPLMPTALPAVVAVTVAKALFLYSMDESSPIGEKVLRFGFAEFAGLAVNNTLMMAHAGPVVAPIAGVATALAIWYYETKKDEAKKKDAKPAAPEANEPKVAEEPVVEPAPLDGQTQPEATQ